MSGALPRPRPTAAAGIAVVLLLALALLLAATETPGGARAQAADCVPTQHSKKVVKRKKVRRHGKQVTVKRKKTVRWTTCDPAPPTPPASCTEPSADLGITARDQIASTFTLSRTCVSAGVVGVHLTNLGEDPHNVYLTPGEPGSEPAFKLPEDPPFQLGPMATDDGSFELTAGRWYLWCNLDTHEELGMFAYLTVS